MTKENKKEGETVSDQSNSIRIGFSFHFSLVTTYTESRKRHGAAAVIPTVMVTRGEAHTYNSVIRGH